MAKGGIGLSGKYVLGVAFALLMVAFVLGTLTMTFYGFAIAFIAIVVNVLVYRLIRREREGKVQVREVG
jgi:membrane protein implicated in regulation of membrane protease activity